MTFYEAALQILKSSRKPLTNEEITERALELGLIATRFALAGVAGYAANLVWLGRAATALALVAARAARHRAVRVRMFFPRADFRIITLFSADWRHLMRAKKYTITEIPLSTGPCPGPEGVPQCAYSGRFILRRNF